MLGERDQEFEWDDPGDLLAQARVTRAQVTASISKSEGALGDLPLALTIAPWKIGSVLVAWLIGPIVLAALRWELRLTDRYIEQLQAEIEAEQWRNRQP